MVVRAIFGDFPNAGNVYVHRSVEPVNARQGVQIVVALRHDARAHGITAPPHSLHRGGVSGDFRNVRTGKRSRGVGRPQSLRIYISLQYHTVPSQHAAHDDFQSDTNIRVSKEDK
ncbi:unnamed protein product [Callosobruchus maculatus]|uniref:Uncharacterized protein n=1 Tax=Callosobruchus maculatus TaxID=64391 RepID=A0A653DPQ8_CALMS|nr:unnamed protein product [Callosobruchus maculatus]